MKGVPRGGAGLARAVLATARASALEALQQPAAILIGLSVCSLVALQPLLQLHSFGESGRLVRDCALAAMLLGGAALCALCSAAPMAAALAGGGAATALARPAPRAVLPVGHWLGSVCAAALFVWCVAWQSLLAGRTAEAYVQTAHFAGDIRDALCGAVSALLPAFSLGLAAWRNIRRGTRIGTAFFVIMAVLAPLAAALLGFWERDGSWLGFAFWDPGLDWRIVAPSLAIWLLLCAFCAGGAAFATRLPAAAAASASFLPFVLGFFADGLASSEHLAVRALAPLLPSVRDFWLAEALANGGSVSSSALPLAALHAAAWSAMALAVGTLALRRRDL